jgi:hypothetical protein
MLIFGDQEQGIAFAKKIGYRKSPGSDYIYLAIPSNLPDNYPVSEMTGEPLDVFFIAKNGELCFVNEQKSIIAKEQERILAKYNEEFMS